MLSPSASSDVVLEVMFENKPIYKTGQIVFSEKNIRQKVSMIVHRARWNVLVIFSFI